MARFSKYGLRLLYCPATADLESQLSITERSLYLVIAFPLLYFLIRRESYDLLNSAYFFIFCVLRVARAALQIKQHRRNAPERRIGDPR